MKKLLATILLAASVAANAQIASDVASNYGGSWGNGTSGGSGFQPWLISNNNGGSVFAGSFIGDSTAGAGNINTSGASFGLFANPATAFINADRAFATSLSSAQAFSFKLALNFDNGNKGFNLYAGSQGQVFNFNVGGGGSVSASNNATLVAGTGLGYNYGGNNAVIDVTISVLSATSLSYNISRSSEQGFQGTLFSGNVNGLTQGISGFRFYVSGTDNGDPQNNLYVNSLSVVPEPSTIGLAMLGVAALVARRTRKFS